MYTLKARDLLKEYFQLTEHERFLRAPEFVKRLVSLVRQFPPEWESITQSEVRLATTIDSSTLRRLLSEDLRYNVDSEHELVYLNLYRLAQQLSTIERTMTPHVGRKPVHRVVSL